MLKSVGISVIRRFWRQKMLTAINFGSLVLGLSVFSFGFLYVKNELSFDRAWADAERIHRLVTEQRNVPGSRNGPFLYKGQEMLTNIEDYLSNEIERVSRAAYVGVRPVGDSAPRFNNMYLVDPQFVDIFQPSVASGDLQYVLETPGQIAVEAGLAMRLVGPDPLGKTIILESNLGGGEQQFQIGATYKLPKNVSISFELLAMAHDYARPLFFPFMTPWEDSPQIWIKLVDGIDTLSLNKLQPQFVDATITAFDDVIDPGKRASDYITFRYQPITEMRLNPLGSESRSVSVESRTKIATIATVSILVLIAGLLNSVSLGLSGIYDRQREIGIRKSAGASRSDILLHHLAETIFITLMALVIAVAIEELFRPTVMSLLGIQDPLNPSASDYVLLTVVVFLAGLISNFYPAMALANLRPKSMLQFRGPFAAGNLHSVLVVSQFSVAIVLLIVTSGLYLQLWTTSNQFKGFNAENLIYVSVPQGGASVSMVEELRKLPGITGVDYASLIPGLELPEAFNSLSVYRKNEDVVEVRMPGVGVSYDYFEIMETPILAGRSFSRELDYFPEGATEQAQVVRSTILNQSAIRALGFPSPESAVDQLIYFEIMDREGIVQEIPVLIVGVAEDSMDSSLQRQTGPIRYELLNYRTAQGLLLRFDSSISSSVGNLIDEASKQAIGPAPLSITHIDSVVANAFVRERRESQLVMIGAGLAMALSCIGLYAMVYFSTLRNVKQIGIRKVMGANVPDIVSLFLWRFSRLVVFANVIAWPIALYFVLQWISQFPYQFALSWILPICIACAILAFLVAALTVSIITTRAAMISPTQSLRYD